MGLIRACGIANGSAFFLMQSSFAIGALFLMNGERTTTTRNTTPRDSADQDDDVIMKF